MKVSFSLQLLYFREHLIKYHKINLTSYKVFKNTFSSSVHTLLARFLITKLIFVITITWYISSGYVLIVYVHYGV